MTLNICIYAGPVSGKSTSAAGVFAKLKRNGINCELITEYAKDKVWEGSSKVFYDQVYILGKQHFRMSRLQGEVDITITDSPILLSTIYNDMYAKLNHLNSLVLELHNRYNTLNYFLERSKEYNPKGRHQNKEEAIEVDSKILDMLSGYNIPFTRVDYSTIEDRIISDVESYLRLKA